MPGLDKPEACYLLCPLARIGEGFSRPEGNGEKTGVAFFGEALGMHEMQEGLPLRPNGESGSLITHIVEQRLKLKRSDFVWDNSVKCRPPANKLEGTSYEIDAVDCCRQYNSRSIGRDVVKVIVALGGVAFRSLTGVSGKKLGVQDVRGYVFNSDYGLVVPSLHPAFIRRGNSRYTSALLYDVKKAIGLASGTYSSYSLHKDWIKPKFVLTGKLEALVSFYYRMKENPERTIFYDIETPWSKDVDEDEKAEAEEEGEEQVKEAYDPVAVKSIQFTDRKDWAVTVPWEKPFIKVALAILALANPKLSFNGWHFDNPRLELNGAKIGGLVHDGMWAWHHMQPGLDKGLQKVASFFDFPYHWKHLANEADKEDEYGGSDVIALAYIWERLPAQMKALGVWDSYLKFKVRYREILSGTEKRGLPVDEGERVKLEGELVGELAVEDRLIQASVPRELLNIKPARKDKETGEVEYGYVREPAIIKELRPLYEGTRNGMLTRGVQPDRIIEFEKWAQSRTGLELREFVGASEGVLEGIGVLSSVKRWCKVEPFKASKDQLVRYIKHKGYAVPLTLKEKKETTGKKELLELFEKTNDEVLRSVIKVRSIGKMLTNDLPNWRPGEDGAVHTTFKFDPPSWQLNAVNPNILNARKHEPDPVAKMLGLGKRFRKIVVAPKGRCVVEFDKAAFHVAMMGFEAQDPLYIKWAKIDFHSLLTSYIVNEPIDLYGGPDLEKIAYIKKKFKTIRDTQAKPTGLGNQLGLGPDKLFYMNRYYYDDGGTRHVGIDSRKRAVWLQSLLAEMFPKVEAYKKRIKEEAHLRGRLVSHYGAIRWFFDVMRWDYKYRQMRNGTEAEQAISHNLQSDAFGMIHSEIIDMANNSDLLEEHWLANTVHDSVICFPEIGKRDKCIEEVRGFMLKPEEPLTDEICAPGGLVVGVDVSVSPEGGNWSAWHEVKNPMGLREVKV